MTQVQETLVAWREAEQRLHAATDPEAIASLTAEVERLRDAYHEAVEAAAAALENGPHPHLTEP